MPLSSDIVATLAATPTQLERLYRAVPDPHVRWVPSSWEGIPGERFHALGQVCHLRDIEEDGYHARIRRTREETRPFLPSLDGDVLARERRYDETSPEAALAAFRHAREATLVMVSRLTDEELARPAEFEGVGEVTLRALIHLLCSHDQQHLACMHWLLAKIDVERAGR